MLQVTVHDAHGGRPSGRPPVCVSECIGCGRVERSRECVGDCRDERLDLVRRADHDRALAALSALDAVVGRLREGPAREEELRALQADARAALRELPEGPAERIATWLCATCGRIEAPRPCLGICVHEPAEMIPAADHDAVCGALAARRDVVRQLAWVRPARGQWRRTADALRARAVVLGDEIGRDCGPGPGSAVRS